MFQTWIEFLTFATERVQPIYIYTQRLSIFYLWNFFSYTIMYHTHIPHTQTQHRLLQKPSVGLVDNDKSLWQYGFHLHGQQNFAETQTFFIWLMCKNMFWLLAKTCLAIDINVTILQIVHQPSICVAFLPQLWDSENLYLSQSWSHMNYPTSKMLGWKWYRHLKVLTHDYTGIWFWLELYSLSMPSWD